MSIDRGISEWIEIVADEITSDDNAGADTEELVWEAVDGSEWVIYYGKAESLVQYASDDQAQDAYENAALGEPVPDLYRDLLRSMAFYILLSMLTERVEQKIADR